MIEVKNLVKKYGNHLAVDHLDFQIKPGMVYGFLGPNGAGKSTTMNIMTGCMGATQGEVLINGYDILKEPEKAKRYIGYLPEHPPLYMDMTVREYLLFVAELKGTRKKADRIAAVENACARTGLQEMEGRLIRTWPCRKSRPWRSSRCCITGPRSSSWTSPPSAWTLRR